MDIFLQALISYMVIVDPVGVALVFHALAGDRSWTYRRTMAVRAVLISCGLVVFFGFFGQWLLGKLGISLDSFKIAGGLLLFYTSFSMVVGAESVEQRDDAEVQSDISVFPLSIPLLAGPGCLTLTVLLFTGDVEGVGDYLFLLAAIAVVFGMSLFCLLAAGSVSRVLGETGNSIMKRLLGVLLAALSIQFIADGVRGLLTAAL
jgi:multiple antibiotic resistance protein